MIIYGNNEESYIHATHMNYNLVNSWTTK